MILVARAYDTGVNLGADRYCAWLSKLTWWYFTVLLLYFSMSLFFI